MLAPGSALPSFDRATVFRAPDGKLGAGGDDFREDRGQPAAKLRPSNIDASAGAEEEIARIVTQIRARWPKVRVLLRADSGFARERLMAWCEKNRVDFVFGLARNPQLVDEIYVDCADGSHERGIARPE